MKYLGKLEKFIGCQIIENKERDTIWIHQPELLKHLKETFGKMVENVDNSLTALLISGRECFTK